MFMGVPASVLFAIRNFTADIIVIKNHYPVHRDITIIIDSTTAVSTEPGGRYRFSGGDEY